MSRRVVRLVRLPTDRWPEVVLARLIRAIEALQRDGGAEHW